MKMSSFTAAGISIALIACMLAFATSRVFYLEAIRSVFFSASLLSANVFLFLVRPRLRDVAAVIASTSVIAVLDFAVLHFPHGATIVVPLLSMTGLSALMVLALNAVWSEGSERRLMVLAFIPALLLIMSDYFASDLLALTSRLHPKTLDLYLYSFDASLGIQFSFILGKLFAQFQWLKALNLIFYIGLPLPLAIAYSGQLRKRSRAAIPGLLAIVITGPLGVLFYNLFPATGPHTAFLQLFPWHPLTTSQAARLFVEPISIPGPRNAIPSLHMAWVLLAWWNSRGISKIERFVILMFVLFTVTATMGTGEHYIIDLVVAVPFAIFVQALSLLTVPLRERQRWLPMVGGLVLTLTWLVLLRFATRIFWSATIVPWAMVLGTLALGFYLYRMLSAERSEEGISWLGSFFLPDPMAKVSVAAAED